MATQYLTRKNAQWWRYDNVEAVTVETLNVMSAEYRDLFTQTGDGWAAYGTYQDLEPADPNETRTHRTKQDFDGQSGVVLMPGELDIFTQGYTDSVNRVRDTSIVVATETVTAQVSDDVAHEGLRQTQLTVSHWRIDRGSSFTPRYIYATWADGDTWADFPPGYLTVTTE